VEQRADPVIIALTKERIAEAAERVLRDCISLGSPPPEFVVRVGRENVEPFDALRPGIAEILLPGLDPVGVIVHMNIPPDRSFKSVACSLDQAADELCVVFAENVQDLLVEGELWGHAWPPCPVHCRRHPLWPELADDDAVWMCTKPPTFAASVGTLRSAR